MEVAREKRDFDLLPSSNIISFVQSQCRTMDRASKERRTTFDEHHHHVVIPERTRFAPSQEPRNDFIVVASKASPPSLGRPVTLCSKAHSERGRGTSTLLAPIPNCHQFKRMVTATALCGQSERASGPHDHDVAAVPPSLDLFVADASWTGHDAPCPATTDFRCVYPSTPHDAQSQVNCSSGNPCHGY